MVIREHRGSFLQLFYQRFQASMKLRHEVQCSLLEVGVQTLGKLKRPKRQPVAGISDVATDGIRELGRPVSYDETRWAFRTILRRKSLANCRRTIENVRVRSAEIRPYVLDHECYLSLQKRWATKSCERRWVWARPSQIECYGRSAAPNAERRTAIAG